MGSLLPNGDHVRVNPLEDFVERRSIGHLGRRRPLLLHARVLGTAAQLPHPLPLHRLVDHCPLADDRVLLDSRCGAAQPRQRNVLTPPLGHHRHARVRLLGGGKFMNPWVAFVCGLAGWGFILFEIFAGEAGKVCADDPNVNKYVKESFNIMRLIVTIGWSIYPLGYFFGYLCGAVDASVLNLVYNLADFVNKIAFCLAIWASAKNSTIEGKEGALLG